jgi:hypothetical protein
MSFAPVPNAPAPDVCARVQALCEAAAAAAPAWTPSPEVEVFTHSLNASNIAIVNTRASALTELQLTLASPTVSPLDRIQAGITIQHLPFIRLSKKARADLLIRPFITVARAFNRHLMKAKEHTGAFLTMLGRHHTFSGVERRFASAAGARTPHCKLDFGEFNDVEIPPHLLPPPPAKHREIPSDSAPATPKPAATDPAPAAPPAPAAEPLPPIDEQPATTESPSTSSTPPAQESTPAPLPPPPEAPAHTPSAFTTAPPGATPPNLTI